MDQHLNLFFLIQAVALIRFRLPKPLRLSDLACRKRCACQAKLVEAEYDSPKIGYLLPIAQRKAPLLVN